MLERALGKLTSGQWILTVTSGFTVSYCVVTATEVPEWAQMLFSMVFALYFTRKREPETVNEKTTTTTTST